MIKKKTKKESEKKMNMGIAMNEVVYEFAKTTLQLTKKYKRLNKVSNSQNIKNLKEVANGLKIQRTLNQLWKEAK